MKAEQPERLFFAKFIYLLNLPSYFCRAENKSAILIQNNRLFIHNYGITELVIIRFLFEIQSLNPNQSYMTEAEVETTTELLILNGHCWPPIK